MARFDDSLLQILDREREVQVRVQRRDGTPVDLPIWIVTVGEEPYVRSFRGERGAWYRRARERGRMTLIAGDRAVPVAVEPAQGEELNRQVSDAFTAKYGRGGPTRTMISDEVAATTLHLLPAR